MHSKTGRSVGLPAALLLLAAGTLTPSASGQGNTFNPYGNSGYRDYREFTQPMYSNDPSLPGQARLQGGGLAGGSRANQFDAYSESLDARDADPASSVARRPAPGEPYYRAFRRADNGYQREYSPKADADESFAKRLKKRNEDYEKAVRERDPAKRAQLLRQLERDSLDRPASKSSDAGSRATARAGAAAPAAGSNARIASPRTGGSALPSQARGARPAPQPATRPATTPAPARSTTATRPEASAPAPEPRRAPPSAPATTDPSTVPTPAPR